MLFILVLGICHSKSKLGFLLFISLSLLEVFSQVSVLIHQYFGGTSNKYLWLLNFDIFYLPFKNSLIFVVNIMKNELLELYACSSNDLVHVIGSWVVTKSVS